METLDRLGWAAGVSVVAYGCRIGIRVSMPEALDLVPDRLPPGWAPSTSPDVEQLYSLIVRGDALGRMRRLHLLYANAVRIARSRHLEEVLSLLERDLSVYVGERARRRVFVHAGVVGWRGQAVIIPGVSFSGKTSLVAALVRAGAIYYSDEFAVFDANGRVHPFPTSLSIRTAGGAEAKKFRPEVLGASIGHAPLPVGLVAVTRYRPQAHWRPVPVSPGRAVLALLAHTVPARLRPRAAMTTLRKVVAGAIVLKGPRGEAEEMADVLLNQLERSSGSGADSSLSTMRGGVTR